MMYELGKIQDVKDHSIESIRRLPGQSFVALTGAGISVHSGLPLGNAVVTGVKLADLFRASIWNQAPECAFEAYRTILSTWRKSPPNTAHYLLAQHDVPVITQNIDGLHRDAGSKRVIELHGNLRELRCRKCSGIFSSQMVFEDCIPACPSCKVVLYPGFTLEGEPVRHIARAVEWISTCHTVLIVGTQLSMHPVRSLREVAKRQASDIIWITEDAEDWLSIIFS
jgi:NAD-dependent deacetylase